MLHSKGSPSGSRRTPSQTRRACAVLSLIFAAALPVHARGSATWVGGVDFNWSNGANWTGGAPAGSTISASGTDTAFFNDGDTITVYCDSSRNVQRIDFGTLSGFNNCTINNGSLLLTAGGAIVTDPTFNGFAAVDTGVTLEGNGTLLSQGLLDTSLEVSSIAAAPGLGAVTLTLSGTTGFENFAWNSITGGISSGAGSTLQVVKNGSGTWSLNNSNTYPGGTILAGGVLTLGNSTALGTAGAIEFQANTTLRFASTPADFSGRTLIDDGITATFDTNGNSSTFSSAFATGPGRTGGLTKWGTGTLTLQLAGSSAETYTGPTTIAGGTLLLSYIGSGAVSANMISGSSPLVLAGSTLNIKAPLVSGTASQAFAGTTLAPGFSAFSYTTGSSAFTVDYGVISRSVGGLLVITGTGFAQKATGSANDAGGVLRGLIYNYNDFASLANGSIGVSGYVTSTNASSWTSPVTNYQVTSTGSVGGVVTSATINALQLNSSTSDSFVISGTLALNDGILFGSGIANHPSVISGGRITGPAGGDLIIYNNNGQNNSAYDNVASSIVDNGTTSLTLGPISGTLWITGSANTYSGGTVVGGNATVNVSGAGASLGSSNQVVLIDGYGAGCKLQVGNGDTTGNVKGIVRIEQGALSLNRADPAGSPFTLGAQVSGSLGMGVLSMDGTGSAVVNFAPGVNLFWKVGAASNGSLTLNGPGACNSFSSQPATSGSSTVNFASGAYFFAGGGNSGGNTPGNFIYSGAVVYYNGGRFWHSGGGSDTITSGTLYIAGDRWDPGEGTSYPQITINLSGSGVLDISQDTYGAIIGSGGTGGFVSFNQSGGLFQEGVSANADSNGSGGSMVIGGNNPNVRSTYNLTGGLARIATKLSAGSSGTNSFNWTGGVMTLPNIDATYFTCNDGVHTGAGALYQGGSGVLSPGDTFGGTAYRGSTTITGGYVLDSGTLLLGIGGTTAATGFHAAPFCFDKVVVNGTATLGGTLSLYFSNGYFPAPSDTFLILAATSVAGSFQNVTFGSRMLTADGLGSCIPYLENNDIILRNFVWLGAAPQILTQPQNNVVLAGKSSTFSVQVTGSAPFTYQWYKNGAAVTTGTLPWLTIGSPSAGDAANYYAVISNAMGSATTSTVSLTVNPSGSAYSGLFYNLNQAPLYGPNNVVDSYGATAGTLINSPAPLVIPGPSLVGGNAWDLSQSSAYVQVGAGGFLDTLGDTSQGTGMTVAFWVKLPYQGGGGMNNSNLFGIGSIASAYTPNMSDPYLFFSFGAQATFSANTVLDGTWHFVVATIDYQKQTNNEQLFIDGASVSTITSPVLGAFNVPGTALGIGGLNGGGHSWAGAIDNFYMFNRALVVGEVSQLYSSGTVTNAAPVVAMGADNNYLQWPGMNSTGVHALVTPLTSGTWTRVSGPAATISGATSANATVAFSGTGNYVFRYAVGSGTMAVLGELPITVIANLAPVVNSAVASPAVISDTNPVLAITLSGWATDDGLPNPPGLLTTTWSQVSGPGTVSIPYPHALTSPATLPSVDGTYVLQFSAYDGAITTSSNVTVIVSGNLPPAATVDAAAHTVTWNGSSAVTTLLGSLSDDGRPVSPGILSGTWTQLSGPGAAVIATSHGSGANNGSLTVNSTVTLPVVGQYVFQFAGTDGAAGVTGSTWINVWAPGVIQVLAGRSQTTWLPNATVTLTGTCLGGVIPSYKWSVARGPAAVTFSNSNSRITTASFTTPGKYRLLLTGSQAGYTGQDDVIIEVYSASQNYGYSPTQLSTYFTGDWPVNFDFTNLNWSRIAPPPPAYTHPRILFSMDDLPDLRARLATSTTCGPIIMNTIRASAANLTVPGAKWRIIYDSLAAGDMTQFNVSTVDHGGLASALMYESFRALIDNDSTGGAKVGAAVATLANSLGQTTIPPLLSSTGLTDYRAIVQGPCFADALGWAYDFAYNFMTPGQQAAVRQFLSVVVNNEWNVGLDALPGYQGNDSNWIPLTGQSLLYDDLAIEGESGWDPDLVLRYEALYDRLFDSLAHPDGDTYEGMGKGWIGIEVYFALAKRGANGIASETVRNHIRQFYLQCMETTGYAWTWEEVIGGSNLGAKYPDVAVMKFLYPNDPIIDFMYRNACGQNYAASGNFTGGNLILAAICAQDYNSTGQTWDQAEASQVAPNAALTHLFNMRGLLATRSDWTSQCLRLLFQPRSEPGGHSIPDRNQIVLSGMGREWIPWYVYGSGAGYLPGDNSMPANVVRVDGVGSSTVPANMVDFVDTPNFTYAAGDAKDCYSMTFTGNSTPASFTANSKLLNPVGNAWMNNQWAYQPNWYTSANGTAYWQATRNTLRAFRTACLVRGGTGSIPYSIIVDDIQMDSAVHNYKWRSMLSPDLTNAAVSGSDCIITSTNVGSNVSMLVRVLSTSGSYNYLTNNTYEWFTWPWIDIQSNSVAPAFKVLLMPYVNGTQLPATVWHGNVLYVQWPGGQTDHILFAPNPDGRTRVSFTRNVSDSTPPVLTAPGNITVTASTALGNIITYSGTAVDNIDGPVPVVFSPPSGSLFPIGVTTVQASANDSNLNGSGTSFTVTVLPGSFGLTAPAATAQGGESSVTVSWTAVPPAASYNVMRSTASGTGYSTIASGIAGTRFVDTGLSDGTTYFYLVNAVNGTGTGPNSNEASATPAPLPGGWSSGYLGAVGLTATATVASSGTASLTAAGAGLGGTGDSVYFASQPWTGDGTMLVRLLGYQNANNSSRAGVMFRQTLANNAPFAFMGCQSYAAQYGFVSRSSTGASAVYLATAHSSLPEWFKLVRSGTTFTGYSATASTPGVQSWTLAGSAQIAVSSTLYAGIALASANTSATCAANFDSFAIYTPPVINPAGHVYVEATGSAGAVATFVVTGSSNVEGVLAATCSPPSGSLFPLGDTTVTATITNGAGDTASETFVVTVRDTTSPVIKTPGNLSVYANTATGAYVTFSATGVDLVSGTVPVAANPASGSFFPIGTTAVALSGSDAAGNIGAANINITVSVPAVSSAEQMITPGIITSGSYVLTIRPTVPGRTYQLQRTDTLTPGSWINIGPVYTGGGANLTIADLYDSSKKRRFYRLLLGP